MFVISNLFGKMTMTMSEVRKHAQNLILQKQTRTAKLYHDTNFNGREQWFFTNKSGVVYKDVVRARGTNVYYEAINQYRADKRFLVPRYDNEKALFVAKDGESTVPAMITITNFGDYLEMIRIFDFDILAMAEPNHQVNAPSTFLSE